MSEVSSARASRTLVGVTVLALAACSAAQPAADRVAPADSVSVGYGSVARDRLTGAVSSVEGPTRQGEHIMSVADMLQRLPGVQVSRFRGDMTVRIRGTSSFYGSGEPLCVIDGTPVSGQGIMRALALIPASDIARIDVLKDAGSTAIYGSRGGNGVILVTTRKR